MRNKRGQFFLLAAVIISAILITFGTGANKAEVNPEIKDFYSLAKEIKKESSFVLNYDVKNSKNEIENFLDILAIEIRRRHPDSNFIFIYGTNVTSHLRSYGSYTTGFPIEFPHGKEDCYKKDNFCKVLYKNKNLISIKIKGKSYDFKLTKYPKFFFVIQKDLGDETFIAIE